MILTVRSERATERKFQGAKVPGNEKARERVGQGANRPVLLAREREGSVPVFRRTAPQSAVCMVTWRAEPKAEHCSYYNTTASKRLCFILIFCFHYLHSLPVRKGYYLLLEIPVRKLPVYKNRTPLAYRAREVEDCACPPAEYLCLVALCSFGIEPSHP